MIINRLRARQIEGIVLHTSPSRERDKLVVFVSAERGKMRGWAYGARSVRSRYGASLETLSKIRIQYVEKEGEDTVRLESAELVRSIFEAQRDLAAGVISSWIAELTDTFVQADEPAERPYRLLDACCAALGGGADPELVAMYFELWILRLSGIFPSLEECIDCGRELEGALRFDASRAGFVCGQCGGRSELIANDVRDTISRILNQRVDEFARNPPPLDARIDLRALVRDTRRHFLGHELRSWEVMQTVLHATRR